MSKILTAAEIAEARRLCETVTPGPYEISRDSRPDIMAPTGGYMGGGHLGMMSKYDGNDVDAKYVVTAMNLLPRALRMIDILTAEADDLRRDAEKWRKVREECGW